MIDNNCFNTVIHEWFSFENEKFIYPSNTQAVLTFIVVKSFEILTENKNAHNCVRRMVRVPQVYK